MEEERPQARAHIRAFARLFRSKEKKKESP